MVLLSEAYETTTYQNKVTKSKSNLNIDFNTLRHSLFTSNHFNIFCSSMMIDFWISTGLIPKLYMLNLV